MEVPSESVIRQSVATMHIFAQDYEVYALYSMKNSDVRNTNAVGVTGLGSTTAFHPKEPAALDALN